MVRIHDCKQGNVLIDDRRDQRFLTRRNKEQINANVGLWTFQTYERCQRQLIAGNIRYILVLTHHPMVSILCRGWRTPLTSFTGIHYLWWVLDYRLVVSLCLFVLSQFLLCARLLIYNLASLVCSYLSHRLSTLRYVNRYLISPSLSHIVFSYSVFLLGTTNVI